MGRNDTEIVNMFGKDAELRDISDFNRLLMALTSSREHDLCLRLFANLQSYQLVPDCRTYSIMLRCYCEKNDVDEAKNVLDLMLENGFQPDVATVTILLNSFCKRGKLQKAFGVLQLMDKIRCKPTIQTYNCLLKGLCYVGKVEEASELLTDIKKKSFLKLDVYSYTAVMDGFCKVGRSDEAMELLNEATEMGITPNVVTFNSLLQGYSREGRPLEGIHVLKLMKKNNCFPDYISYTTLLHGLLKWNEIRAARKVYKEMVTIGFEVDLGMMRTLVKRLCRESGKERDLLEYANQVFEEMKNRVPTVDQRIYGMIIEALSAGNRVDEALTNLNDMITLRYSPWKVTFHSVIQALCSQGRTDEALSTLLLMYANGRTPNPVSFNIMIRELMAQGKLFSDSILFGAAIKLGAVTKAKHCYVNPNPNS
ncbi:hypothetical protein L6164_002489 [Bauhinia variegata]|nr:hypothetical protein L6164_002489 [Bauhinia variegata]